MSDNSSEQKIQSTNKRKHQDFNQDDIHMNQSFSQLSISQRDFKKKKNTDIHRSHQELSKIVDNNNNKSTQQNDKEENKQSSPTINCQEKSKPQYLKVSDRVFKQMLSNSIKDGDKLVQLLDTNEKLQFVRQMTEVTNNLQYLTLQRQLWQDYYNIGINEGDIWPSQLSKADAKLHHTCRTYGFHRHIIEKRQQKIKHHVQRTIHELQQYLIKLQQNIQQWQPFIDPDILSNSINECVKNGQKRLRHEFDYKRKMLEFNSNDHRLIKQFYDLQPNEEEVC